MTADPSVAIIILAAGLSTRFGNDNKLLEPIDDVPIIVHTVKTALLTGAGEVIVVTGHDGNSVEDLLADFPAKMVRNVTPKAGMGTSLAAGANAIRSMPDNIMIMLGDMPFVKAETLMQIASHSAPDTGHDIVVPIHDGRRGHPVMFGARYLPQLCALTGDIGARDILRDHPERVRAINVSDPGIRYDIDTVNDLNGVSTTH